jgi:hypothetical protein
VVKTLAKDAGVFHAITASDDTIVVAFESVTKTPYMSKGLLANLEGRSQTKYPRGTNRPLFSGRYAKDWTIVVTVRRNRPATRRIVIRCSPNTVYLSAKTP